LVDEGRYAPKTINNAPVTLVACLNDATRTGKLPRNPAARIAGRPRRASGAGVVARFHAKRQLTK
jgi:hypothetical protein